jgi:unsaturated rhamnogalacturonyl hydrolase
MNVQPGQKIPILQKSDHASYQRILDLAIASALSACNPATVRWNYENGLILQALMTYARSMEPGEGNAWHKDLPLVQAVKERIDSLVKEDGSISGYRLDEYNIDHINAGKVILELRKLFGDGRYHRAIKMLLTQLESHPRTSFGSFWHKKIYPNQVWLDGVYMAGPFLSRCAIELDRPAYLDDVCRQIFRVRERMRDSETGLYFHAMDESRSQPWSNPESGLSPHVWGRAVGWLSMALADMLDWMPSTQKGRSSCIEMFSDLMRSVAKAQHESGLWYQVMDRPERTGNYLETSASAMFAYSILKGCRLGYLEASLTAHAKSAIDALIATRVRLEDGDNFHLDGICRVAGLGGTPYRDGSFRYYIGEPIVSDDYKGTGPFIMALTEAVLAKKSGYPR